MFALTFQGKIVQIEKVIFDVHKDLVWVDISGTTPAPEVGWSYDGVVFTAPPPPPVVTPPPDADLAERAIRRSKAFLALGRIATGNDTLTEDALVALARAKLP